MATEGTTITIDSTEGTTALCDTYNGTKHDVAGWERFVETARAEQGEHSCYKVRVIVANGDTSMTLDVEIDEDFSSIHEEAELRLAWTLKTLTAKGQQGYEQMAEGYRFVMDALAA